LLKPEVARQLQELLDLGFIRPSDSEMASPTVCVLKGRNGENGVRLCCDFRYLNKFARGDSYPTPDINNVIHTVGKVRYYLRGMLAPGTGSFGSGQNISDQ